MQLNRRNFTSVPRLKKRNCDENPDLTVWIIRLFRMSLS